MIERRDPLSFFICQRRSSIIDERANKYEPRNNEKLGHCARCCDIGTSSFNLNVNKHFRAV